MSRSRPAPLCRPSRAEVDSIVAAWNAASGPRPVPPPPVEVRSAAGRVSRFEPFLGSRAAGWPVVGWLETFPVASRPGVWVSIPGASRSVSGPVFDLALARVVE